MAEKKAAVEVKQEGEFTLKGKVKPKKPKQLGKKAEVAKVDLSKDPNVKIEEPIKVDLTNKKEDNAVQAQKTNDSDVVVEEQKDGGNSKGVVEEIRSTEEKVESPIEIIEEIKEEEVKQKEVKKEDTPIVETPKLPENVDKLVKFMEETGGTVEDYVELNKDYSKLNNDQLLTEYLRKTKPHLDSEDINLIMEDYKYDEDIDEQKDIRRKKLAYKEAVASARQDLESRKNKYYAEIKQRPGVTQEQQKAMDFFNRYNKQQETIKQTQEDFQQRTKSLFNTDFKGFDYNVGDKKFRYKVQDPSKIAETQANISNFVEKFLDKDGKVSDTEGYHKALYAAMNADKLASHFYEQGKADGVKDMVQKSKNPSVDAPRQVAGGDVYVAGFKVKAISGADSSKLKIKKRTFNN
jgi:hypothetical protein